MYGYQFFEKGFPEKAGMVYRHGLQYFETSKPVIGKTSKEVIVRMMLALSETCIAIKQLEEAAKLLEEVWIPGNPLSIDRHHQHFLWLSRLYAHLKSSHPYCSDVPKPSTTCATFYQVRSLSASTLYKNSKLNRLCIQRLGIHHTASKPDIRKAYLKWSRVFHPDRGGDTGIMQQV